MEDDSWADQVGSRASGSNVIATSRRDGSRTPPYRGPTAADGEISLEARVANFEEALGRAAKVDAYDLVTKHERLEGGTDVGFYALVQGYTERPDLNGRYGMILGFDCNSKRIVLDVNSDIVLIPKAALRTHR